MKLKQDKKWKALIVGFEKESLSELRGLVDTLGMRAVETVEFKFRGICAHSLLSSGRLERIKERVCVGRMDTVVFDSELTPAQYKNLEKSLKCVVVDRTELILQIFALHAKTSQAKLQIEIAQLRYLMPRLRKMWTHFSRIHGGIGGRGGLGETQLEIDRRRLSDRIKRLEKKLKIISRRADQEVQARGNCFKIVLIGYTNVGKSTLLNHLTGANVLVDDKLFATLDTVSRKIKFKNGVPIVITDTVGFINKLPHNLVASFTATLTEINHADLLVYVLGANEIHPQNQLNTIKSVLKELGAHEKPYLTVFNKIDAVKERFRIGELKGVYNDAYFVSATKKIGLKKLTNAFINEAEKCFSRVDVTLGFHEGQWLDYFKKHGRILKIQYVPEGVRVSSFISQNVLNHFYHNRN